MELRPYQVDALSSIEAGWDASPKNKNQLLVLATSLGKTVCFSELARRKIQNENKKVLVIAHREELLEQAQATLEKVTGLRCGWEQADRYASLEDKIVVASVASLGRTNSSDTYSERLRRFPPNHFGYIYVDEAHHAVSNTYLNVLEYFGSARVLGVTATPKRGKNENLSSVFSHVAYELGLVEASLRSLLAPLRVHRISSTTDLSGLRTTAGDYNLGDLAKRVNNVERNELIFNTYSERFAGRQAIIYATDLEHARSLSKSFKKKKISAEAITGDMDKEERRAYLKAFREGSIRILTNFGVLTEGFDHPPLDLIISTRPTQSSLLLTQIIGRGLRTYEGKTHCDLVEVVDLHSELTATCASLFGFENTFDAEGVFIGECTRAAKHFLTEKPYFDPWGYANFSKMRSAFHAAEDPKIIRERMLEQEKQYRRQQEALSAERRAAYEKELAKSREERAEWEKQHTLTKRYRWTKIGDSYRIQHQDWNKDFFSFTCAPNSLGSFTGEVSKLHSGEVILEVTAASMEETISLLEQEIAKSFRQIDVLLNENAGWKVEGRSIPCTDAQWRFITQQNMTDLPREQVSKTTASDIISKWKTMSQHY